MRLAVELVHFEDRSLPFEFELTLIASFSFFILIFCYLVVLSSE